MNKQRKQNKNLRKTNGENMMDTSILCCPLHTNQTFNMNKRENTNKTFL